MAHKKKHKGPIPPNNRAPGVAPTSRDDAPEHAASTGSPFQDQDQKRRLGDFEGAGEHSIQQPGGRNDANH